MSNEKSFYEVYRERVKNEAIKLETAPKEIPQHILWLKSIAIERVENIDRGLSDNINTFRVLDGKEVSLTQAMNAEKEGKSYKFGFTEHYVNILMYYAYEAGMKAREDSFKKETENMSKTLERITDILDEAGFITHPDY